MSLPTPEAFFKFKENGTNMRTEIMAGVTTFLAMCYILFVNSGIFSNLPGVSFNSIYFATALSAIVGTVIMALLTNLPLGLASGLGINAFFVFTCCLTFGFTYENSLLFVLADGIIFVILTCTGLRALIFNAVPKCVKSAISVGLGLFIVFIGLQSTGFIVNDDSTLVNLKSFNLLGGATWAQIMPLVVTFITVILMGTLLKKGIKTGIFWAIIIGSALYFLLGLTIPNFKFIDVAPVSLVQGFSDWATNSWLAVFKKGFDFSAYLSTGGHNMTTLVVTFATSALAFCMLDMFDTLGTLFGACRAGNLLVDNPETGEKDVPNLNKAMLADAIATCFGAVFGTSTVTTYVESAAGIGAGGKTGLVGIVVAILFFIAMFFAPLAAFIPGAAYGAALIYVGLLMMGGVADIDWTDPSEALPSFLTMVIMPFAYNVSYGIAFGIISYIVIKTATGEMKKISLTTLIIGALFLATFLLTH